MLKNKTAVITGCNRGIGKAILEDYVKNGADIFAVVRKKNDEFIAYCDTLKKGYGVEIQIVYADFADENQVKEAAQQIVKE